MSLVVVKMVFNKRVCSSKRKLVRALGGAKASSSLLGVPLGHNSSFLQGPAFAPPRIREAIWCGSTNATTEEGGDHSISYPVVRAVSEKLGGPVDVLHLDAHPDIYGCFEGNKYSHASSFARIMEGGYARRLLQVGIRSITSEGREQGKRFGVEQYEMRTFSKDRHFLENLVRGDGEILSQVVSSQADLLARYGGVAPKMAEEAHSQVIDQVVQDALDKANLTEADLSAVAVTIGPGLSLCLRDKKKKKKNICTHQYDIFYLLINNKV
ncbi:putative arginase [Helianthus annuus]|nr:putative arginase [Helianthus annuus]